MCTGKIGRCLARRGELVVAPDFNEAQETYHEVKAREDTAAYDQTEKVLVIRSSHTIVKPLRWEGGRKGAGVKNFSRSGPRYMRSMNHSNNTGLLQRQNAARLFITFSGTQLPCSGGQSLRRTCCTRHSACCACGLCICRNSSTAAHCWAGPEASLACIAASGSTTASESAANRVAQAGMLRRTLCRSRSYRFVDGVDGAGSHSKEGKSSEEQAVHRGTPHLHHGVLKWHRQQEEGQDEVQGDDPRQDLQLVKRSLKTVPPLEFAVPIQRHGRVRRHLLRLWVHACTMSHSDFTGASPCRRYADRP